MLARSLLPLLTWLCVSRVFAAPSALERRSVTKLTPGEISAFTPSIQFARVAYCPANSIQGWNCGGPCDALPGFEPTLVGGDGDDIQNYFVGYWPPGNTIVVAHQGTDPSDLMPLLTDLDILLVDLDSTLFPGVPSSVRVHEGFRNQHFKSASLILQEVNKLLTRTGVKSVTCVGHSLGGALAQLDSLLFSLNLNPSVSIKAITYGLPRVGNPAYAAFFDSRVPDFQRMNHAKDIIPIMPGRFLGFEHPHGEVHLISPNYAVACPGDDDATDPQCQIQSVPNIFDGDLFDHLGPYNGLYIGNVFCA